METIEYLTDYRAWNRDILPSGNLPLVLPLVGSRWRSSGEPQARKRFGRNSNGEGGGGKEEKEEEELGLSLQVDSCWAGWA